MTPANSIYIIKTPMFYGGENTDAPSYVVNVVNTTVMKDRVLRNTDLVKTQLCRRTLLISQTSVRFLKVAVALCLSGLLVQHFERLCAFRDTAVEQDYRSGV